MQQHLFGPAFAAAAHVPRAWNAWIPRRTTGERLDAATPGPLGGTSSVPQVSDSYLRCALVWLLRPTKGPDAASAPCWLRGSYLRRRTAQHGELVAPRLSPNTSFCSADRQAQGWPAHLARTRPHSVISPSQPTCFALGCCPSHRCLHRLPRPEMADGVPPRAICASGLRCLLFGACLLATSPHSVQQGLATEPWRPMLMELADGC